MEEKIIINNDYGEKQEFDILFTFESKTTQKKYVTYTNYDKDSNGNIICYSSYYNNELLVPATNQEDLESIECILNTITESTKEKYKID